MLLPALPGDPAETDELAAAYLDGPHASATLNGVRLAAAISQAMANGRRVDEKPEGAKRLGVGLVRYARWRISQDPRPIFLDKRMHLIT